MSNAENPLKENELVVATGEGSRKVDIYSQEGFELLARLWTKSAWEHRISYNVTWLGVPIIQLPEDILTMQELIQKTRPDTIVETGTAHGGSSVFYASMLELVGEGQVISVDVEIRQHNRLVIQNHPMSKRITLIEGSSVDEGTFDRVLQLIRPQDSVMVVLDSNHTYAHVLQEMEMYSQLVTPDSYLVVFDGVMEILADVPGGSPSWEEDSPAGAIRDFLARHDEWELDALYRDRKVTYCPDGILRRKRERQISGC